MGWYQEQAIPRIVHVACAAKTARPLRSRVCAGLSGEVIEVGFGSGLNLPFYPPEVSQVDAVEPSDVSWNMAATERAQASIAVLRSGRDAQLLPYPDNGFDAGLSTWTLCTIPDAATALRELHRVLRPGAPLHFVEHGLAEDNRVRRLQRRIDPVHARVIGCHVTRPIVQLLTSAGFAVTELEVFYQKGAPKFAGACALGVALAAAPRAED